MDATERLNLRADGITCNISRPGTSTRVERQKPEFLVVSTHASVLIPSPAKYMARLCNHFAHRVTVHREATSARIDFPNAPCSLKATDGSLEIHVESEDAAHLERLQEIISRHLKQVAAAEVFDVTWNAPTPAGV